MKIMKYKSKIPKFNWNSDLPIRRETFEHYVETGYVVFDQYTRNTIIHFNNEYHIFNNGKWLGPYATENEARFWIRALP